jgi:hypothetical protein
MDIMRETPLKQKIEVSSGEEKYRIEGTAVITANGIIALVLGGERPHIGAVAIAVPRASLRDKTKISTTASVITLPAHKDDEIAKPAAERLARELNEVAVVIAGVHVENATDEEIGILISNSKDTIDKILKILRTG